MRSRVLPRRPRYADIAATSALVLSLGGTAYAATTIADPNSVNTAAIQNLAVTTPKLADEAVAEAKIAPSAVTHGKVADSAITGSSVADHSLTLSDLSGAGAKDKVSFALAAHSCGYLALSVSGAKVGQEAMLSWTGTSKPPQGVMVGPLDVVTSGHVVASACNVTGHKIRGSKLGVRVVTLG
jgi:type II secretory pathway component PulM